jgi:hypothetical protein
MGSPGYEIRYLMAQAMASSVAARARVSANQLSAGGNI